VLGKEENMQRKYHEVYVSLELLEGFSSNLEVEVPHHIEACTLFKK